MAYWEVRLAGERIDIAAIEMLAPLFGGQVVFGAENAYWLRAQALEQFREPDEVHHKAREIVSELNGMAVVAHPDHKPVVAESSIAKVEDKASRLICFLVEGASFRVRGADVTTQVLDADGNVISQSSPRAHIELAKQIAQHPELRDVLKMLAGDVSWQKLRLAWEALSHFAGGEHKLKARAHVEKVEYDRFKANCHNIGLSGHEALHFSNTLPNQSKMTESQGREWIGNVMRRMFS